jgi:hypothetical protein
MCRGNLEKNLLERDLYRTTSAVTRCIGFVVSSKGLEKEHLFKKYAQLKYAWIASN